VYEPIRLKQLVIQGMGGKGGEGKGSGTLPVGCLGDRRLSVP